MVGTRQDTVTEAEPASSLTERVRANAWPLGTGAAIALAAIPAGVQPWQAVIGYGALAASLLVSSASGRAARINSSPQ